MEDFKRYNLYELWNSLKLSLAIIWCSCFILFIFIFFYRTKYGIDDFTPLEKPDEKKGAQCSTVERYIPPYNGFGSYEDSLGNCFSMEPKPPKTDFVKFIYHDKLVDQKHKWFFFFYQDLHFILILFKTPYQIYSCRYGFESHVLRFRAKLISNITENNERHFIVRVFLTDNTISIFELAIRNSGMIKVLCVGLFQERSLF